MFKLFLLALISLAVAYSATLESADFTTPIIRQEMIEHINSLKTTWTAHASPRFMNATVADVKRMLGTVMPDEPNYVAPEILKTQFRTPLTAVPENFDARTAFPQCVNVIGHVRDQSNCGSCWAFGSTEALNDRLCIKTGSQTLLSPEDTVSCCSGASCAFSMGCNGGQPTGAWNWFVKTGVSTGGDWGDRGQGSTCKPYSMQTCSHHVDPIPEGYVGCPTLPSYKTPSCTSTCSESTYPTSYSQDKVHALSSYGISGIDNIQREIMEGGTVSVAMTVYEDFEAYQGGVYQHVSGKSLGGHAIKMIGWGVDNGTPYWTCVNSWNPTWGEGGAFRILRGKNECGIEGSVVAGSV